MQFSLPSPTLFTPSPLPSLFHPLPLPLPLSFFPFFPPSLFHSTTFSLTSFSVPLSLTHSPPFYHSSSLFSLCSSPSFLFSFPSLSLYFPLPLLHHSLFPSGLLYFFLCLFPLISSHLSFLSLPSHTFSVTPSKRTTGKNKKEMKKKKREKETRQKTQREKKKEKKKEPERQNTKKENGKKRVETGKTKQRKKKPIKFQKALPIKSLHQLDPSGGGETPGSPHVPRVPLVTTVGNQAIARGETRRSFLELGPFLGPAAGPGAPGSVIGFPLAFGTAGLVLRLWSCSCLFSFCFYLFFSLVLPLFSFCFCLVCSFVVGLLSCFGFVFFLFLVLFVRFLISLFSCFIFVF